MTTPPATPPTAKKTAAQTTDYVILTKVSPTETDTTAFTGAGSWSSDDMWAVLKTTKARSATEAIKDACKNADDGSVFVAIPKRSWQPLKATVETKTTIRLG